MTGATFSVQSTPTKASARAPKAFTTPVSSVKKRKTKNTEDGESDGENHMTPSEDETPTKSRKTAISRAPKSGHKTGSGSNARDRDISNGLSNTFEDANDLVGMGSPTPSRIRVKDGNVALFISIFRLLTIPAELIEDPFRTGEFSNDSDRAKQLQNMTNENHSFDSNYGFGYGIPTPNGSGNSSSFHDSPGVMDGGSDHIYNNFAGHSMGNGMGIGIGGMDMGMHMNGMNHIDHMSMADNIVDYAASMGMQMPDPLVTSTSRLDISNFPQQAFPTEELSTRGPRAMNKAPVGRSSSVHPSISRSEAATTDQSQERRSKSTRKASQMASERQAAWIQADKEEGKMNGERSSEEDSLASAYQSSDDEFV